jgi:hypothetical protein
MTELEKEKKLKSYKWGLGLYNKPKDTAELLYKLLFQMNKTYYIDRNNMSIIKIQSSGQRRSKQDIFRIMHTYNKKVSYKQVGEILNLLIYRIIYADYCPIVQKIVHYPIMLGGSSRDIIANILKDKNIKF